MMTPREIVRELDRHIVGQDKAKRAVAVALRNRWRRMQLSEQLRREIMPKNILMIGSTGVGKTEIARRLAHLSNAPFIKVEATKFTEVGYVGRNVESIIRDLCSTAVKQMRERDTERVRHRAEEIAEETILNALLKTGRHSVDRQTLRVRFRQKELDSEEIEVTLATLSTNIEIMTPPGMEGLTNQLQGMFEKIAGSQQQSRRLTVKQAFKALAQEEAQKLINDEDVKGKALESVEQNGIVFIDEIDKVTRRSESISGGDVSREGVQRDLLPLVEGCTVSTRYGTVKTNHILFIASGAFHTSKPSDLVPELQGRFPIRVELQQLTAKDFVRILKDTDISLIYQYIKLMETEQVKIEFSDAAIRRIAEIAYEVNVRTENIGARRLHTAMEYLLEEISFVAPDSSGRHEMINVEYVDKYLAPLAADEDLSRYIL